MTWKPGSHGRAFVAASIIATLCVGPGCAQNLPTAVQSRFDDLRSDDATNDAGELLFPGGSLAVILPDGETLTFVTGAEDVEGEVEMSPDLRMPTGSVGKLVAGALAAHLVVDGRLDPDTRIERWFGHEPWFAALPNAETIAVRHLLHHSSGLNHFAVEPDFAELMREFTDPERPGHDPAAYPDFATLMSLSTNRPALFAPGEGASYSESGYLLLGAVLGKVLADDDLAPEDVFRAEYYAAAEQLIFEPLGMADTTPLVGRQHEQLAQGYVGGHPALPSGLDKMVADGQLVQAADFEFSGGGFVSTARDLATLVAGISKGLVFEEGAERDRFVALVREAGPVETNAQNPYGFGPVLRQVPSVGLLIGHEGEFPGYRSLAFYSDSMGIAIAIQVNTYRNDRLFEYAGAIADVVATHM